MKDKRRSEFYTSLLEKAPFEDGEAEAFVPPESIPWFSPLLWEEGQKYVKRNYAAVILLQFAGFLFNLLSNKPNLAVLFQNGKDWFKRSVGSGKRILSWYESDFNDENCIGFRSIKTVRKLHSIHGKLKEPLTVPVPKGLSNNIISSIQETLCQAGKVQSLDWGYNVSVSFSQRDMWAIQFMMTYGAILCPQKMGIPEGENPSGFLHIWAVFGRMLGLKDEYNLALHGDKELYSKIMEEVFLPSLRDADGLNMDAFQGIIQDFNSETLPIFRPFCILYFLVTTGTEIIPTSENKLWRKIGWVDRAIVRLLRLGIWATSTFSAVRWILNYISKKLINYFVGIYDAKTGRNKPIKTKTFLSGSGRCSA